jgi:hypothetical protein
MGYTRVEQYGAYTEIYLYEQLYLPPKKRSRSKRRKYPVPKSDFTVRRAKKAFRRLVEENLYTKGIPAIKI